MHLLTILFLADDTFIYVFSRIFYRLIVSGGYVANAELAIFSRPDYYRSNYVPH